LLFIDAAKGKYKQFFNLFSPMLSSHGVIITDNVLFKGYVYEAESASKRMSKLAGKIDEFNQWLCNLEEYHTVLVPVGDGIAITTRKA
jgi:predicted O-methyltransferase YrrM